MRAILLAVLLAAIAAHSEGVRLRALAETLQDRAGGAAATGVTALAGLSSAKSADFDAMDKALEEIKDRRNDKKEKRKKERRTATTDTLPLVREDSFSGSSVQTNDDNKNNLDDDDDYKNKNDGVTAITLNSDLALNLFGDHTDADFKEPSTGNGVALPGTSKALGTTVGTIHMQTIYLPGGAVDSMAHSNDNPLNLIFEQGELNVHFANWVPTFSLQDDDTPPTEEMMEAFRKVLGQYDLLHGIPETDKNAENQRITLEDLHQSKSTKAVRNEAESLKDQADYLVQSGEANLLKGCMEVLKSGVARLGEKKYIEHMTAQGVRDAMTGVPNQVNMAQAKETFLDNFAAGVFETLKDSWASGELISQMSRAHIALEVAKDGGSAYIVDPNDDLENLNLKGRQDLLNDQRHDQAGAQRLYGHQEATHQIDMFLDEVKVPKIMFDLLQESAKDNVGAVTKNAKTIEAFSTLLKIKVDLDKSVDVVQRACDKALRPRSEALTLDVDLEDLALYTGEALYDFVRKDTDKAANSDEKPRDLPDPVFGMELKDVYAAAPEMVLNNVGGGLETISADMLNELKEIAEMSEFERSEFGPDGRGEPNIAEQLKDVVWVHKKNDDRTTSVSQQVPEYLLNDHHHDDDDDDDEDEEEEEEEEGHPKLFLQQSSGNRATSRSSKANFMSYFISLLCKNGTKEVRAQPPKGHPYPYFPNGGCYPVDLFTFLFRLPSTTLTSDMKSEIAVNISKAMGVRSSSAVVEAAPSAAPSPPLSPRMCSLACRQLDKKQYPLGNILGKCYLVKTRFTSKKISKGFVNATCRCCSKPFFTLQPNPNLPLNTQGIFHLWNATTRASAIVGNTTAAKASAKEYLSTLKTSSL